MEKRTLESIVRGYYKDIFEEISPKIQDNKYVIPYFGERDSSFLLALKDICIWRHFGQRAMRKKSPYPDKEIQNTELVRIFQAQPLAYQKYSAYSLSHELQIAAVAAYLAMENQENHVYEIGCDVAIGAYFYKSLLHERVSEDKPCFNITAYEISYNKYLEALWFVKMIQLPFDIQHADAIPELKNRLQNRDIVFASLIAPKKTTKRLIELAKKKKISLVVSYSQLEEYYNKSLLSAFKQNYQEIIPFQDSLFLDVSNEKRHGVILIP